MGETPYLVCAGACSWTAGASEAAGPGGVSATGTSRSDASCSKVLASGRPRT